MPTDYELKEAYEKGLKEGAGAERERLRTFIGLRYIAAPNSGLPEHLAYPEYEVRLQQVLAETEHESERLRARRVRLIEASVEADRSYDEALEAHRQEREASSVFGKLKSVVTEPFLREKSLAKDAGERLERNRQDIMENDAKLDLVRAEHAAVSAWVDEMYTVTMAAGQQRAKDRVAAARDTSSRTFRVFTMDEYLNGDEHRRLPWGQDIPGGADFSSHWRRDGDDELGVYDRGLGNWRAVWIPENQETALFISSDHREAEVWLLGSHIRTMNEATEFFRPLEARISERNSLALVMDAYTEAYLGSP